MCHLPLTIIFHPNKFMDEFLKFLFVMLSGKIKYVKKLLLTLNNLT